MEHFQEIELVQLNIRVRLVQTFFFHQYLKIHNQPIIQGKNLGQFLEVLDIVYFQKQINFGLVVLEPTIRNVQRTFQTLRNPRIPSNFQEEREKRNASLAMHMAAVNTLSIILGSSPFP